jgi:hypothetical protein
MPCVSFSANSTSNIPWLLKLVQILRTQTLNIYLLSRKCPIEDLEYSWLQSPNIPNHIDEYLFLLKEIFRQKKPNTPGCSIESLRRAAVGRGRAPPPPTSPKRREEGSAAPRVRVWVQGWGWCQGFASPPPSLSNAGLSRMLGPPMPCVSFSANSTSNIPGLLTLVQVLRTRTLNVYLLSHKCPIEDL